MVKTRLIAGGVLWTILVVALTLDPSEEVATGDDESEEWQRFSSRCSSDSLRTISPPEADFIANDRDGCHVSDFWTADIRGLYTMTSAALTDGSPISNSDPAIRLIELSIAAADADEDEGWTPEQP